MQKKLRDTAGAAARLNVAKRLLEKWRQVGRGPRYIQAGRLIRYDDADLDDFIEANRKNPASNLEVTS